MYNSIKSYSKEKIADIYLMQLFKISKNGKLNFFLNEYLENKKIYHDQEIVDGVIKILIDRKLISVEDHSVSISGYPDAANMTEALWSPKTTVASYNITSKGKEFAAAKQFIDVAGNSYNRNQREKWLDRILGFIGGALTTLVTGLLSS